MDLQDSYFIQSHFLDPGATLHICDRARPEVGIPPTVNKDAKYIVATLCNETMPVDAPTFRWMDESSVRDNYDRICVKCREKAGF